MTTQLEKRLAEAHLSSSQREYVYQLCAQSPYWEQYILTAPIDDLLHTIKCQQTLDAPSCTDFLRMWSRTVIGSARLSDLSNDGL